MPVRWGVVGLGRHAVDRMLPAFARARYARLGGVYSRRADVTEAVARARRVRGYPALDALLGDPEIDAVYLATPNDLHKEQTVRAAAAGKHVLVEKPMALSIRDAADMIGACAAAGVRLYVGFHLRFHPAHLHARALVAAGEIGDVVWAGARWTSRRPRDEGWRLDPGRAGGTLLTARGVHLVDLIRFVCGTEFRTVAGFSDGLRADRPVDDTSGVTGALASGGFAHVICSRLVAGSGNDLEIGGTRGTVACRSTIGAEPGGALLVTQDGTERSYAYDGCDVLAGQVDWVSRVVTQDAVEAIGATGEDGGRVTAVTVATAESVRSGEVIALHYPF